MIWDYNVRVLALQESACNENKREEQNMNRDRLQQITNRYIERFEELNALPKQEYYKWQIINRFRPMMENALSSPSDEFSRRLDTVRKMTQNIIDSRTLPFRGLVEFAKEEPDTVRRMFVDLFQCADAHNEQKIIAIHEFLNKSHHLREEYFRESFLFNDDLHSVTGYLFMYDPDHNYLYKATHCRAFADCVEFYDDWGYGADTKMDVFFRMCDAVLAAIKENEALMATAANRYEIDPVGMHPDSEKHILLFDLIYCCTTYDLFKGIEYIVPNSEERRLVQERKNKARELSARLETARQQLDTLDKTEEELKNVFLPGAAVQHKAFGEGRITEMSGLMMTVLFKESGQKRIDLATCLLNGLISISEDGEKKTVSLGENRDILRRAELIRNTVTNLENELIQYAEYLD